MAAPGSLAERQEFFRGEAKPPCSFRDRPTRPLMTAAGRIAA